LNFSNGCYLRSAMEPLTKLPALRVGDEANVEIKVVGGKVGKQEQKFQVHIINEYSEDEVVGKVGITYEVIVKPNYSKDVVEKAKLLNAVFTDKSLEVCCEAVKNSGKLSIEELIESFLCQWSRYRSMKDHWFFYVVICFF